MKIRNYLLLLLLATLWGPSFLLIKLAIEDFSPVMMAALRITIAALFLNAILLFKSEKLSLDIRFWKHVLIAGFFAHALPFLLFSWGEQYIDSSLASILNGLTPLCTVLLAHFTIREESITLKKILGIVFGFAGLLVLILPQLSSGFSIGAMGALAVTVASMSYAVAMVYARKHLRSAPSMHAPAAQLLVTAIYMLPLAWFFGGSETLSEASSFAWFAVVVLGVFGTALAFIVYYQLLDRAGPAFLSMVTYLLPVFGVVLGVVFLKEQVTMEAFSGMLLILLGIVISNGRWIEWFRSKLRDRSTPKTACSSNMA